MKVGTSFLLFLTFFFSSNLLACSLEKKMISFSAPITAILEELSLLQDKNLMAISSFHTIDKPNQVKQIPGGIFLSRKKLKTMSDSLIFFDKSLELKKQFAAEDLKSIEIDTRGLDPFEAHQRALKSISTLLIGCKKKVASLNAKIEQIKRSLKLGKYNAKIIFFLGGISKQGKLPTLVIASDGPILFLKNQGLSTYESSLAYVSWSSKQMKNYKGFKLIGLVDEHVDGLKIHKISKFKQNIIFRGLLSPGLRQIFFLNEFASNVLNE